MPKPDRLNLNIADDLADVHISAFVQDEVPHIGITVKGDGVAMPVDMVFDLMATLDDLLTTPKGILPQ